MNRLPGWRRWSSRSSRAAFQFMAGFAVLTASYSPASDRPSEISADEWASITRQIEMERYRVVESERPRVLYSADNPEQRFVTRFGAEDVVLAERTSGELGWEIGIRLVAWGERHQLTPVGPAAVVAQEDWVEFRRGLITEWYRNSPIGLEQRFIIDGPPMNGMAELVLEMVVGGDLEPSLNVYGDTVSFRREGSSEVLNYSGLASWDAVGDSLETRMWVSECKTRLRLAVAIDGAAWPVYVDPLFSLVSKLLPTPDNDNEEAKFGQNIDVDGDHMVVGVEDSSLGEEAGAAHIFKMGPGGPGDWIHVARLLAFDGKGLDNFGHDVAISGDYVIVGAPGDVTRNDDFGTAYVFHRNSGGQDAWGHVLKTTSSYLERGDGFGRSVSVFGDIFVVGAPYSDVYGSNSGSAYVFRLDGGGPGSWQEIAKLVPTDGSSGDAFGAMVSVDGGTVVVGAPYNDDRGRSAGAAYIFSRDHGGPEAWGQEARLHPSDIVKYDAFGGAVSVNGDLAIVGANGSGAFPDAEGKAFIFRRDGLGMGEWSEVGAFAPEDGIRMGRFGFEVDIDGDVALVGACRDDDNGAASGSVYVYRREDTVPESWAFVKKIVPEDGSVGDYFGNSVMMSGDVAVFAAAGDDDSGYNAGSVYVAYRDAGGSDGWGLEAKIPCPEILMNRFDRFGYAVAIDGDAAIVGAFGHDVDQTQASTAGAAYIFTRDAGSSGWSLAASMFAPDLEHQQYFGAAVAIDGDTTVVGASGDNENYLVDSGAAYVFERDHGGPGAWGRVTKLVAPDPRSYERFGKSVATDGDTILVGKPNQPEYWDDPGSVFVFRRDVGGSDSWELMEEIGAVDGQREDEFGVSVSISGDTAIVGAVGGGDHGRYSGAAYVFRRTDDSPSAWVQVTKLLPPLGAMWDFFGRSVAISGDTAIVGSVGAAGAAAHSGAAYVFEKDRGGADSWGLTKEIVPVDGERNDEFGRSVSISGDLAIVGSARDVGGDDFAGSVYVFDRDEGGSENWGWIARIRPPDGGESELCGLSVGIDGIDVLVGCPYSDESGEDSGSAYLLQLIE